MDSLIEEAKEIVLREDRAAYDALFAQLEQIVGAQQYRICGTVAAQLILDEPISPSTYYYEVYITGGHESAKQIVAELPGCVMNTDIKNAEFTVVSNGRRLIKLYNLPKHHGVAQIDSMTPITRRGYFCDCDVGVVPEEMLMMAHCRSLYNCAKTDNWVTAYEYIIKLWASIAGTLIDRSVTGGRPKQQKVEMRLPRDAIIVGDRALKKMGIVVPENRHRQILSAMPIDDIANMVSKSIKRPVRTVRHNVGLPDDFQLTKHTIYAIVGEGAQRPVLDVFNSPAYEIVSVIDGVGSPWVVLRFLLLDIWLLKLVRQSGRDMNRLIASVAGGVDSLMDLIPSMTGLFEPSSYVGTNLDERVAKKKIMARLPTWIPPQ